MYDFYNPIAALENSYKMLKETGHLVILEWNEGWLGVGPSAYVKLQRTTIIEFVESVGFNIESINDYGEYFYTITANKNL